MFKDTNDNAKVVFADENSEPVQIQDCLNDQGEELILIKFTKEGKSI